MNFEINGAFKPGIYVFFPFQPSGYQQGKEKPFYPTLRFFLSTISLLKSVYTRYGSVLATSSFILEWFLHHLLTVSGQSNSTNFDNHMLKFVLCIHSLHSCHTPNWDTVT